MTGKERFYLQMALEKDDPIVRTGVGIAYPVWLQYGEKLDWLVGFSKYAGVGISKSQGVQPNTEVINNWGEKWIYPLDSLDGICIGHPIASWDDLKAYTPPDPDAFTDWKQQKINIENANKEGNVSAGGTDHGFIFLRLTYLRGYENLMMDIADERPELYELISIVENYWFEVVRRWIECGVTTISFGDDMGTQKALPISPDAWRKFIKPSYKRIISYCRAHGVHTSLHSDGYIVDIIPELIELGVSSINPQDLVNGLENIKHLAKGKAYINLDIDRQNITVFGTPEEVDAHILNCIKTVGSPNGGMNMVWGVYPATPIENIEAAVRAMDKYATYWVDNKE
jgi:uroporphyrinogen decarboxylase